MESAQAANVYLNELEPWRTAKTDMERTGTSLAVALDMIATTAVVLSPYLPTTSARVLETLGLDIPERGPDWAVPEIAAGTKLGPLGPLFSKVELEDED